MAGEFISQLPAVPSAQLSDIYPVTQGATTYKESVSQLVTLLNSGGVLTQFVRIAGSTMTGPLILSGDATLPLQAVTYEQLQTVASGITVVLSCQAATTVNLNATQAGAGIGATLTNAGTQAAFAVDGYSASINDRILVKNQTLTQHNGIYTVTTLGSPSTNWVLTRATDYDTAAQIKPGTLVAVNNGGQATTSWLETATVVTVDTDPVLFSQFTFSPAAFLLKANNLSDVASVTTSLINLGLGTPTGTYPGNVVMQTLPSIIGGLHDANGNIWIEQNPIASAVNGFQFTNAAANGSVALSSIGANTDINLLLNAKGSASVFLISGGAPTLSAAALSTPSVNYFNMFSNTTGNSPIFQAVGADTNIIMNIQGKGTGGVAIQGTGTNNDATTGEVGEFIQSQILFASRITLTTAISANVTAISLPSAGDYDVWGNINVYGSGGAVLGNVLLWSSLTSATFPDNSLATIFTFTVGTAGNAGGAIPQMRYKVSAPTTVYLSCQATFTGSGTTASGGIYARRRR